MVVNNLYVQCIFGIPSKTQPILIINPDAVLAFSFSLECFEAISPDFAKVLHAGCRAQSSKFDLGLMVKPLWEKPQSFLRTPPIIDIFSALVLKTHYAHVISFIPDCGIAVKSRLMGLNPHLLSGGRITEVYFDVMSVAATPVSIPTS